MAERDSPEWWADRLVARLNQRRPQLDRLERYHAGRTPLAYATSRFREEFGTMLGAINDNWCPLVVGAVDERLNLDSFQVGTDAELTARAREIWVANGMDVDAQIAHYEALKLRETLVMVWPSAEDGAPPVITVEHPSQVIVELDPENRSRRLCAVKSWRDEEHGTRANVYLPAGVFKFRRGRAGWEPYTAAGEVWPLPNPFGVVPVVPIANRPGLTDESVSEIENILSMQDMINKLAADMIVAAEYSAFRQRWATGVDIPTSSGTDLTDEDFINAVNRLWHTPAPDAKFGEFGQTDLSVYVRAIEMMVQHIASQTSTPAHYLLNTGQLPSGESLRAAEAPLVAKARRKQRVFGAAWAEVMRLALLMDRREVAAGQITVKWQDPETRTESEHVDAITKMKALDIPGEMLWEMVGLTADEILRAKAMRLEESVSAGMSAAPAAGFAPSPVRPADTPEEIKEMADAMGVLIRAGVSPTSAADRVGLAGISFTGAVPTSLRLPESQTATLESV